jgi:hypothetical protein
VSTTDTMVHTAVIRTSDANGFLAEHPGTSYRMPAQGACGPTDMQIAGISTTITPTATTVPPAPTETPTLPPTPAPTDTVVIETPTASPTSVPPLPTMTATPEMMIPVPAQIP